MLGSLFYNYKGSHSIVLLGVSNAKYRLIYIDVGANGRISDGGVFLKSSFGKKMLRKQLNLPPPQALPNSTVKCPYVFVADAAFASHRNLIKPFGKKTLTMTQR